jgi:hypothetical protein
MTSTEQQVIEELQNIKRQATEAIEEKTNAIQDHVNLLDVKIQQMNNGIGGRKSNGTDDLKSAVAKAIQSKETEVKNLTNNTIHIKSVFTTDVTGGLDHTFYPSVVLKPRHLVNVTDLIGSVRIEGGSFSYASETVTGAPAIQVEGAAKADISIDFDYDTVKTEFIAGITEVSRQFLNNFTALSRSIPAILDREYYKKENQLYSTELFAKATASTITGDSEIEVLTKNVSKMMGDNIVPTAIVLHPTDYTNILLNETTASSGYDLPNVVTISENGMVAIMGVPVYMAVWVAAGEYIVMNGNKVLDVVQEGLNLQIDNSEKFSKNISIFRIEKQSNIAILAPWEVVKGDF